MTKRRRLIAVVLITSAVTAIFTVLLWCRHERLYRVTVLPRLGMRVVVPCAINDHGKIVGVCRGRFYLWERGRDWRELGRVSEGLDINNAGQIVGTVDDPNGRPQAFLWDPNDGLTILRILGTGMSAARALNNRGQIAGLCRYVPGLGRVFIWSKTHGTRFMGGSDGRPIAMNDAGQVIGYCASGGRPRRPFLWEPAEDGSMTETPLPAGALCGINNYGYVLGQTFKFDERRNYAFIWRQDQGIQWLSPLGTQTARVAALNDANQVAVCEEVRCGWLERLMKRRLRPCKESFLWTRERGRVFLDGYLLDKKGEYFAITDLNNKGCIIGAVKWRTGGVRRAILLEPISERWGR